MTITKKATPMKRKLVKGIKTRAHSQLSGARLFYHPTVISPAAHGPIILIPLASKTQIRFSLVPSICSPSSGTRTFLHPHQLQTT